MKAISLYTSINGCENGVFQNINNNPESKTDLSGFPLKKKAKTNANNIRPTTSDNLPVNQL
ncbi:hypothetical protein DDD_0084 [Nonlabens dokdonensis DSW-6]|uniref:Uncharacterized protein n=1 Tax=Nonlabens dokdonensis (strain DSM 17205 / KCTC 12402 / DSW-6) TaxID=592029 RepID=L7W5Z3_NONDD|nr:hypothetical protein DDD_0084 [Nonlabens dokdonensis DSW-6]